MEQQWNEESLLTGVTNQFGIYQINETTDAGEYMFESKAYMERMGIELTRDKYDLVYVGEWTPELDLEKLFTKFNIDRPADFKGHSLSMSDVVLVHENGENTAHYVDTIGFAELPDFLPETPEVELFADNMAPEAEAKRFVSEFKAMTGEYFHEIGSMKHDDLESFARTHLQAILSDYSIDATITDAAVVGMRARGIEDKDDPIEVMMGVSGAFSPKELKELFDDEAPINNNIKIEAQIVPVSEEIPFATYIEQTQIDLARKQAEYAMNHQLTGEALLAAQIGAYIAENGAMSSPRDSDAGSIAKDLRNRDTAHLMEFFTQMSEHGEALQAVQAKAYLEKMAEYKPLAKVEELLEQNYNMIDDRLNNMKQPEEPHKQEETKKAIRGRQSLRARLEDKKRLIAQLPVPQAEKAQTKKLPDVREP